MKTFMLLLALAFEALAQSPVTISQNVVGPDGGVVNGRATFTISAPCQQASQYIQGAKTVPFLSGGFSVSLWPNDSCDPSYTYYTVTWITCPTGQPNATTATPCPQGGTHTWFEKWRVTPGSVTVADVVIPVSFTSLALFPVLHWSSLTAAGWFSINPQTWSNLTR